MLLNFFILCISWFCAIALSMPCFALAFAKTCCTVVSFLYCPALILFRASSSAVTLDSCSIFAVLTWSSNIILCWVAVVVFASATDLRAADCCSICSSVTFCCVIIRADCSALKSPSNAVPLSIAILDCASLCWLLTPREAICKAVVWDCNPSSRSSCVKLILPNPTCAP